MDIIILFVGFIIIGALGILLVDGFYKINEEEGKKKEGKNMSKKIYKGYELIKAIASGEIKENSRIDVFTDYGAYITTIKYKDGQLKWKTGEFNTGFLCSEGSKFELREDETIDIERIKEVESNAIGDLANEIKDKLNKVIRGLKQLNKEIKELKSLDIEFSEKEINEALKRARNKEYCQVCGVELTEENKYMKNMCYDCKYGEE